MSRKAVIVSVAALALLLTVTAVSTRLPTDAAAQGGAFGMKIAPLVVPLQQVKMSIAGIRFTGQVPGMDGNQMKLPDERLKSYRIGVVTIRIQKPAGMQLTIAAADLTLHYYHGNSVEVAPCEGISVFSTAAAMARGMKLPRTSGPGWVKMRTDANATQASEVYVDAVFGMMEPNTRECWLCVGQPTAAVPFTSQGWR